MSTEQKPRPVLHKHVADPIGEVLLTYQGTMSNCPSYGTVTLMLGEMQRELADALRPVIEQAMAYAAHEQAAEVDRLRAERDRYAAALDNLGARIYRDLNPDSAYAEVTTETLTAFAAYAGECLSVLTPTETAATPEQPQPDSGAEPTTSHGYSAHGHPCCDQAAAADRPTLIARCGGAGLCRDCREDAAAIHNAARPQPDREDQGDEPEPITEICEHDVPVDDACADCRH